MNGFVILLGIFLLFFGLVFEEARCWKKLFPNTCCSALRLHPFGCQSNLPSFPSGERGVCFVAGVTLFGPKYSRTRAHVRCVLLVHALVCFVCPSGCRAISIGCRPEGSCPWESVRNLFCQQKKKETHQWMRNVFMCVCVRVFVCALNERSLAQGRLPFG